MMKSEKIFLKTLEPLLFLQMPEKLPKVVIYTYIDAMKHTITLCKAGASINDICVTSDAFIKKCLANIYTKKKYIKGLAFPTSISVNEVCGNYAPAKSDLKQEDHEYRELSVGDVVKIDMGVQIQGFASVIAHTLVVTAKPDEVVTGNIKL